MRALGHEVDDGTEVVHIALDVVETVQGGSAAAAPCRFARAGRIATIPSTGGGRPRACRDNIEESCNGV